MKIGIVVSDPKDWTAQALLASFSRKGIDAFFLDFSELVAFIGDDLIFRSGGSDLLDLDGLVVRDLGRRGAVDVSFRFEVLQALVQKGIPVINPPEAIARAANKFATSRALHDRGVPTPKTIVTTSPDEAEEALHRFGKAVSKPLFGYKGRDILLLKSGDQSDLARLRSIVETKGWSTCRSSLKLPPTPPATSGPLLWMARPWAPYFALPRRGSGSAIWPAAAGLWPALSRQSWKTWRQKLPALLALPTAVSISWKPVMVYRSLR